MNVDRESEVSCVRN